jgi:hypothetical protein
VVDLAEIKTEFPSLRYLYSQGPSLDPFQGYTSKQKPRLWVDAKAGVFTKVAMP